MVPKDLPSSALGLQRYIIGHITQGLPLSMVITNDGASAPCFVAELVSVQD